MKVYKIEFYVPASHAEQVKEALFSAGAGRIGDYDCTSWETLGIGQFRPLEGSNPFLGNKDAVQKVKEYKVEMICAEKHLKASIEALKRAHPYETPAYSYWKIGSDL